LPDDIKLSKTERRILANQYTIMQHVDPPLAGDYAAIVEALESGYELAYLGIFDHISDGLSSEGCGFVIDVLSMYDAIQRSYKAVADKSGIEEWDVEFHGFDGNNETEQYGYALFVINKQNRFEYLTMGNDGMNSHMELIPTYRRMLRRWKAAGKRYDMAKEELQALLKEAHMPD
jgi:uncharacterized protein YfbU (UPF0304 family)